MRRTLFLLGLVGMLCLASGQGRMAGFDFAAHEAVMDSLSQMHPRLRGRWLNERGFDPADFILRQHQPPEGTALRQVGKWGRGRAVEVTGQDSLVFLSLGSEIAILNFSDPDEPRLLTELQLDFCPTQTHVRDSLLVTGGWSWIETWNIANPVQPVFRGRIPHPVADFCVQDSLLFLVSGDSFRVFSIADPARPYQLGASRDSGWATTVTGNTVVLVLHSGFGFMDVSDPRAPRRVGFYGGNSIAASARGTICCISNDEGGFPPTASFEVLDITNPATPVRLSKLTASGGYDIHLADTLAFVSGWQHPYGEFCIIDISDSTRPAKLGTCVTPGSEFGVWVGKLMPKAFVAGDERGLKVIDIADLARPELDTSLLRADYVQDVYVLGNRAYVANDRAGLRVLDVTDPSQPFELGGLDSLTANSRALTVKDSFAYAGWLPTPALRSICVSDPARPVMAGGFQAQTVPTALVASDTLVYLAGRFRFQVVNVARPREPVLVGVCTLSGTPTNLWLSDTIAFASKYVINVADPARPRYVGTLPITGTAVAIRDTFLFALELFDSISVFSITEVASPRKVASLILSGGRTWNEGIELVDSLLYIGGDVLHVVNVADPLHPVEVGRWIPPWKIRRLRYAVPYLYAACWEAGVSVLEPTLTGVREQTVPEPRDAAPRVWPTVTDGIVFCEATELRHSIGVDVWSVTGVKKGGVTTKTATWLNGRSRVAIDLSGLPAGVYMVRVRSEDRSYTTKVVKTTRR